MVDHNRERSALVIASSEGKLKTVKTLLQYQADPNMQTAGGLTALMIAINGEHPNNEIVEVLLENHADLDIQDERGNTALIMTSERGDYLIVKLLLEKGAKPSLVNNFQQTALHKASKGGHLGIAARLRIE